MSNSVKIISRIIMVLVLLVSVVNCAGVAKSIQHKDLEVSVKMSDTVFLDVETLENSKTVYLRVTNTSDMQEIDFDNMLRTKLEAKGFIIVNKPSQAGYRVQVNVLYMGKEKDDMTAEMMMAGGFGGALTGLATGRGNSIYTGGLIGAAAGSIGGAIIGSMIKVIKYVGVIDVQIQEKVAGGVTGTMKTDAGQGSATRLNTSRNIKSNYQTFRTRMTATADQTNLKKEVAAQHISNRLAMQLTGIF